MICWLVTIWLVCLPAHAQECHCGGLHDAGPLVVERSRVIKWWIGPGTFAGIDQETTRKLVRDGFNEFDWVCGLDFVEVDKKSKARVRIEFKPNINPLGQAWSSGRIEFNSTRKITRIGERRIIQALTCHEVGHVFGLNHGGDRHCVMHPWLGEHWCPHEVARLQNLHGLPEANDKVYWPTQRQHWGKRLSEEMAAFNRVKAQWELQRERRSKFQQLKQWEDAQAINAKVKQLHSAMVERAEKVSELHKLWWAENRRWNSAGLKNIGKPRVKTNDRK